LARQQGLKAGPEPFAEQGRLDFGVLVARAGNLYTLPDICLRLRELVADSNSSAVEIARLISNDPALTARVLQLANSALYGFRARISTVNQAITLIGTNELNNLALATAAAGVFKGIDGEIIDMRQFWRQSVYTALAARLLGRMGQLGMGELLFVVGLLSHIGKLVVVGQMPHLRELDRTHDGSDDLPGDERALLGFTYADVGGALMQNWGLPELLSDCVSHQHAPGLSTVDPLAATRLYLAVRIADAIASSELGEDKGRLELINAGAMEQCSLKRHDLDELCAQVMAQAPSVVRIFAD
jgi:HD-like signal output (HDOD) protein